MCIGGDCFVLWFFMHYYYLFTLGSSRKICPSASHILATNTVWKYIDILVYFIDIWPVGGQHSFHSQVYSQRDCLWHSFDFSLGGPMGRSWYHSEDNSTLLWHETRPRCCTAVSLVTDSTIPILNTFQLSRDIQSAPALKSKGVTFPHVQKCPIALQLISYKLHIKNTRWESSAFSGP